MPTTFLALYRDESVSRARLLALKTETLEYQPLVEGSAAAAEPVSGVGGGTS